MNIRPIKNVGIVPQSYAANKTNNVSSMNNNQVSFEGIFNRKTRRLPKRLLSKISEAYYDNFSKIVKKQLPSSNVNDESLLVRGSRILAKIESNPKTGADILRVDYARSGMKKSESIYDKEGRNIIQTTLYNTKNNKKLEKIKFNEDGKKVEELLYDEQENPYCKRVFSNSGKNLKEVFVYDTNTGLLSSHSQNIGYLTVTDEFYPNTSKIKFKTEFNHSLNCYSCREFSQKGDLISEHAGDLTNHFPFW